MNKKHWSVCLIFLMSCIGYQATLAVKSIDITHKLKKDQATTTHKFKPKTLKINRIIYKNQQNALLFLKTYDAKRLPVMQSTLKNNTCSGTTCHGLIRIRLSSAKIFIVWKKISSRNICKNPDGMKIVIHIAKNGFSSLLIIWI